MGQVKQIWVEAQETAFERYMAAHPDADEQDAYEAAQAPAQEDAQ